MKAPFRCRIPDEAAQRVRGLHPQLKRKIRAGIELLAREPFAGKALRAEYDGLRSLRVGRYRIVYRIASRRIIEIVDIGPRATIYAETLRLIAKQDA